jgi:selenium metabolism protein YedF
VAVDREMLMILKSSMLGEGEPDLGENLLQAFLSQLLESGTIPARIICINSGIFLTTEGSPSLELMKQYEAQGSEILSCGTCLQYYKREDRLAVGKPTNMRDTVTALKTYKKLLQP